MKKIFIALLAMMTTGLSFSQTTLNIGNLDPGDSIIIFYDVTIDKPCNCSVITNQVQVSGSNFTTVNSDDPDTGPLNDATVTQLFVILPVTLTELKAYPVNNAIKIDWKVISETDIDRYEIERSADGRTFEKIGETSAAGTTDVTNYAFTDRNAFASANYYRLKIIERSGSAHYTIVVRVDLSATAMRGMTIFPNPVNNRVATLKIDELPQGQYDLTLYSATGQEVWSHPITHNGGSASILLRFPVNVASGIYFAKFQKQNIIFAQHVVIN